MLKNIKACLSHNTDDWKTPSNIYDYFVKKHNYIDCFQYKADYDEFENDYFNEKLFINPPFSKLKQVSIWINKQVLKNKCLVALLIPARTDTKYFHYLLGLKPTIYFIEGRLHYNDSIRCAPFPSILMIFQPVLDLRNRWDIIKFN